MWFRMRPVDLGFIGIAPRLFMATCKVAAPRSAVWGAFVDPASWKHWWPGVTSVSYGSSPKPYGVGTFRESTVSGQRYEETLLAWDEQRRFAYRIDRATLPIAKAQVECTEFSDHEIGTRVKWTIACQPRLMIKLAAPVFPRIMDRMLASAMKNLEAYLAREGRDPATETTAPVS